MLHNSGDLDKIFNNDKTPDDILIARIERFLGSFVLNVGEIKRTLNRREQEDLTNKVLFLEECLERLLNRKQQ